MESTRTIGQKFSVEDQSRMIRLREEILGRFAEIGLIIEPNVGSNMPTSSEYGQQLLATLRRGRAVNIGSKTYVVLGRSIMIVDHENDTCVIYDDENQQCRPC